MSVNHLNNAAGTVGTTIGAYCQVEEYSNGAFHRTVINIEAYPLTHTDNTSSGASGSILLYTFPKGYIKTLGGCCKWTKISPDGTLLTAIAALEIGVGSTAVGTDTLNALTGTTEDIVTGKGFTLSSVEAVTITGPATYTAMAVFDGTSTAQAVYLNEGASAATSTGDTTLPLTGQIVIDWMNYGYAGDLS